MRGRNWQRPCQAELVNVVIARLECLRRKSWTIEKYFSLNLTYVVAFHRLNRHFGPTSGVRNSHFSGGRNFKNAPYTFESTNWRDWNCVSSIFRWSLLSGGRKDTEVWLYILFHWFLSVWKWIQISNLLQEQPSFPRIHISFFQFFPFTCIRIFPFVSDLEQLPGSSWFYNKYLSYQNHYCIKKPARFVCGSIRLLQVVRLDTVCSGATTATSIFRCSFLFAAFFLSLHMSYFCVNFFFFFFFLLTWAGKRLGVRRAGTAATTTTKKKGIAKQMTAVRLCPGVSLTLVWSRKLTKKSQRQEGVPPLPS